MQHRFSRDVSHQSILREGTAVNTVGSIDEAMGNVLKGVGLASMALLVAAQLGSWKTITFWTVCLYYVIAVALVSALRATVYRISQAFRRRGVNTKTLLVIGGGARA